MIGAPVLNRSTGDGAVDLLDVVGDAGRVGRALQEGRADTGSLDPAFDVLDEVVGHHVDVAVLEVVGEIVVAVDPRAGDQIDARLIGDALHEADVAAAEHRGGLDDRLHAAILGVVDGQQGRVELELLVVAARPVLGDGLVAEADMLVGQDDAQLLRVKRRPAPSVRLAFSSSSESLSGGPRPIASPGGAAS